MDGTKIFSVRTKAKYLDEFDKILTIQNMSRSSVIEKFILSYIDGFKKDSTIPTLKLSSPLSKYKGTVRHITKQEVEDDPRLKHLLGYD